MPSVSSTRVRSKTRRVSRLFVQRDLVRVRLDPPPERRQELEPAEDGNHREREQDGVEVRLHRAVLRSIRCATRPPWTRPRLNLQLVQAEKHLRGLALAEHRLPERVLDRHEERGRAEQLFRRQHALPVAVHEARVRDGSAGRLVGDVPALGRDQGLDRLGDLLAVFPAVVVQWGVPVDARRTWTRDCRSGTAALWARRMTRERRSGEENARFLLEKKLAAVGERGEPEDLALQGLRGDRGGSVGDAAHGRARRGAPRGRQRTPNGDTGRQRHLERRVRKNGVLRNERSHFFSRGADRKTWARFAPTFLFSRLRI